MGALKLSTHPLNPFFGWGVKIPTITKSNVNYPQNTCAELR